MSRQLRELETVEVLLNQGAVLPCFRCRVALTLADLKADNIENEHLHEKKLGGPDEPGNRAFSHRDPCHNLITHGNGATFAGSSRHKIKKATDPDRIEKFAVKKRPPRLKPLDADRLAAPSGRCAGCGECREACACPPKRKPQGFGKRRTA